MSIYTLHKRQVYIEITPPAFTDKTAGATESLFSALHGLGSSRSLREKLIRLRHTFTAEITSSKTKGIRFIIGVPDQLSEFVLQQNLKFMIEKKRSERPQYAGRKMPSHFILFSMLELPTGSEYFDGLYAEMRLETIGTRFTTNRLIHATQLHCESNPSDMDVLYELVQLEM